MPLELLSDTYSSTVHNYKVEKLLGAGAFSKVYRAIDRFDDSIIALKMIKLDDLDKNYINLCMNEVNLLKKVNSPNVIQCFNAYIDKSKLVIALEYADVGDLGEVIQRMKKWGRSFCERTIWYYFHKICNGLKALHEQRILHRDLKPANVFLCQNGDVKLGDLGLSRLFSKNTAVAKTQVGTEYYKAPERTNPCGYHFKSDIWSLGCLLYEMATLRSPFNGEKSNAYALHKKVNESEILPMPSGLYSRHLVFFIQECMNTNPEDRPSATMAHKMAVKMYFCYENYLSAYRNRLKQQSHQIGY